MLPPSEMQRKVEGLIRRYAFQEIRNNTERFRYQSLTARYNTFNELWQKRLRAMEEGKAFGVHGLKADILPPPAPEREHKVPAGGGGTGREFRAANPDGDDSTVFDEMYAFIHDTASPIVGISMLNAPRHTPLYERLSREGRLVGGDFSGEWQLETNIVPKQMTREELIRGYWELFARVYDPELFDQRLQRWLSMVEYHGEQGYANQKTDLHEAWMMLRVLGKFLFQSEPAVRRLFLRNVARARDLDRGTRVRMFSLLAQYRHFHDFVTRSQKLSAD